MRDYVIAGTVNGNRTATTSKELGIMSESKHTPGPWSVLHATGRPWSITADGRDEDAGNTLLVATCDPYAEDAAPGNDAEANAALIAAAPDMLEALRCIRDGVESGLYAVGGRDAAEVCYEVADAALAKAEGR